MYSGGNLYGANVNFMMLGDSVLYCTLTLLHFTVLYCTLYNMSTVHSLCTIVHLYRLQRMCRTVIRDTLTNTTIKPFFKDLMTYRISSSSTENTIRYCYLSSIFLAQQSKETSNTILRVEQCPTEGTADHQNAHWRRYARRRPTRLWFNRLPHILIAFPILLFIHYHLVPLFLLYLLRLTGSVSQLVSLFGSANAASPSTFGLLLIWIRHRVRQRYICRKVDNKCFESRAELEIEARRRPVRSVVEHEKVRVVRLRRVLFGSGCGSSATGLSVLRSVTKPIIYLVFFIYKLYCTVGQSLLLFIIDSLYCTVRRADIVLFLCD